MTKCRSCSQEDLWLWDLPHQEVTEFLRASRMCKTSGSTDSTDLASLSEGEDDGSVTLKEHVGWWEAELNENERRDFPSGPGDEA